MACFKLQHYPKPELKIISSKKVLTQEKTTLKVRSGYLYGFNGQEKDDEIKGQGNSYSFEYRIHDPRLGRFLSIDPLVKKFPNWTPYAFAANRVIDCRDLEGLEPVDAKNGAKALAIVIQGYTGTDPQDGKTQAENDPPSGGVDIGGLGDIQNTYGNNTEIQVVTFSSSQSDNTKNDAAQTINNFKAMNPDGKVIIVGHSLGADNAIELVNENPQIHVDMLITLDIADTYDDDNIPSNVAENINIYQTNDFPDGEDTEADDPQKTKITNIKDSSSTHRTIDNNWKGWVLNKIYNVTHHIEPSGNKSSNGSSSTSTNTSSSQ